MTRKRNSGSEPVVPEGKVVSRSPKKHTRARRVADTTVSSPESTESSSPAAVTTGASAAPANITVPPPAVEEIARLAYSYWEARGYQGGSPQEDWLRAERELSETRVATAKA